ncbi:SpaA isopeptide-forming pilin-related protein [Leucobacter sp. NPDC058333]|uniref:SpaA isopeptide-forming pilin-related protein n=1 Tax=Leucobacter sp. NPDC058333 TaxID=3346450 RepID=UPI0036683842
MSTQFWKFKARRKPKSRAFSGRLAALGIILATFFTAGGALPAIAVPTVTYPHAISNLSITREDRTDNPLSQWDRVVVSGEWAMPDGAVAGDTFGMQLPPEFGRYGSGDFSLTDPGSGAELAHCQVSDGDGPELVCTLTAAVEGQSDVGGTFWISGMATRATDSETVVFEVGDQHVVVDLPGEGGIIPESLAEWGEPYKFSNATADPSIMRWTVGIPSTYVEDGSFQVSDQLDPSLENHHYTGEVWLDRRAVVDGDFVGDWEPADISLVTATFSADYKSAEFSADGLPMGGYAYRLAYNTQADGIVLPGDVFGNTAGVENTIVTSQHTAELAGGGDGSGVVYTRFSLEKTIVGENANAAQDATFTVSYSVQGSDEPAKQMSLKVGQPVRSDRAVLGSTFIIQEIDLPEVADTVWGQWTLQGDGVVKLDDGTYEVSPGSTAGVSLVLQNEANAAPRAGTVSWQKVTESGALLDGSEWLLTGPSGDLAVVDGGANDGDADPGELSVPNLPYGDYTLKETAAPVGFDRTDQQFAVTLGADGTNGATASFGDIVNVATHFEEPPTEEPPTEEPPTKEPPTAEPPTTIDNGGETESPAVTEPPVTPVEQQVTPAPPTTVSSSRLATTGAASPAFAAAAGMALLGGAVAALLTETRRRKARVAPGNSRDR